MFATNPTEETYPMAWEESISLEEISLPASEIAKGETTLRPAPHREKPIMATANLTPSSSEGDHTTNPNPRAATIPAKRRMFRRPISTTR